MKIFYYSEEEAKMHPALVARDNMRYYSNFTYEEVQNFIRTIEDSYKINEKLIATDRLYNYFNVIFLRNGIKVKQIYRNMDLTPTESFTTFFLFDENTKTFTDITKETIHHNNIYGDDIESPKFFYCEACERIEGIADVSKDVYYDVIHDHITCGNKTIKIRICQKEFDKAIERARLYEEEGYNYATNGLKLVQCHECGKYYDYNRLQRVYMDNVSFAQRSSTKYITICPDCVEEKTVRCAHCGNYILKEDIDNNVSNFETSDGINFYHKSCYASDPDIEEYHSKRDKIKNAFYDYYPDTGVVEISSEREEDITGNKNRKKNIHLGFELEVDDPSAEDEYYDEDSDEYYDNNISGDYNAVDAVRGIDKLFPKRFLSYEHDGSLNHGWENISMPASMDYIEANKNNFKKMFDIIRDYGFSSHDAGSCGLHVHLDKKFFKYPEMAEAKLIMIFELHWNNLLRFSRRNRDQVSSWARRYSGEVAETDAYSLATFDEKNFDKFRKDYSDKKKANQFARYHAVNVTNKSTIELRLWRGTLKFETFIATLKFSARLAEIAKNVNAAKLIKMSWEEILGDDEDILNYWATVKDRAI